MPAEPGRARGWPSWSPSVLAALVGAFGIAASGGAESWFQRQGEALLDHRTGELSTAVAQRMLAFQATLSSAQAFLGGDAQTSRASFQQWFHQADLESYYTGARGLGFGQAIGAADAPALEARQRRSGLPGFEIHPGCRAELCAPVTLLEPQTTANALVLGYDMASEPRRREALERARDTAQTALTAPLRLVNEPDVDVQTGVLLYRAVYRRDAPLKSVEERRANLVGWVYLSFRMRDLMTATFQEPPVGFTLTVADAEGNRLLHRLGLASAEPEVRKVALPMPGGRTWLLEVRPTAPLVSLGDHALAVVPAVVGLLLAGLLLALNRSRERAAEAQVHQQTEAARSLQLRLDEQQALLDGFDALLLVADQHGRILRANHTVADRLGMSEAELLGRPLQDLHPPARRAEGAALLAAIFAGGAPRSRIPWLRKDGRELPVEARLVPGQWAGAPAWFVHAADLSALQLSEEKFSRAFQGNPTAMAISRLSDGVWIDVNDAFLAGVGYSREEVLGHSPVELDIWAHDHQRVAAYAALRRDGRLRDMEVEFRHKQGRSLHGLFSGEIFQVQGIPYLLTVTVDLTPRRSAEESLKVARKAAEAASRAKDAFLAMMSHEIRTPLAGVLGMAELLDRTPLDEEQRQYVQNMRSAGDALLTIINDILDFSRVEAGALRFEQLPFSPAGVVRELVTLLRPAAAAKGLGLRVEEPKEAGRELVGDAVRVRQVLTNLVGNAIKFTEAGEVVVRLELKDGGPGRTRLRLEVQDSGIGIAPEAQEKLFRDFVQADGTAARRFGGTGLGLAISKRMVEGMGGSIGLSSLPGSGSTFWFELNLARRASGVLAPSAAAPAPRLSGRVLLAEDNPVNRLVAEKMLGRLGLEVLLAADGRQAVERFREGTLDAILMDMQMPEVDGPEATRLIRGLETGAHVPIIALTANALPEDRRQCFEAGMDDFLAKPVREELLAATLARWLGAAGGPGAEAEAPLPLIDHQQLAALAQQLDETPHGTLAVVLRSAGAEVDGLAAALRGGDLERAARLARALAGACEEVGARRLGALARDLERRALAGQVEEAEGLRVEAEAMLHGLLRPGEDWRVTPPPVPSSPRPSA